jgi:hypothetical protein
MPGAMCVAQPSIDASLSDWSAGCSLRFEPVMTESTW